MKEGWKQVSPAECLKWQIDHDMQEALYGGVEVTGRIRFNSSEGSFEMFEEKRWRNLSWPGAPCYTYYIPEVTP